MAEGLVLDGLDLNDRVSYRLDTISMPPPPKRPQWVTNPDADGAALVSEPQYESRVIEATLRVERQTTMNLAIDKIGALLDKLQLAARGDGIPLVWTPHGSTYDFTFYVLMGELTEIPMETSGDDAGYLLRAPKVRLVLTCKPFGYGTEVTGATVTNSAVMQLLSIDDVPGDVDAEATIVVADAASRDRKHIEVGCWTNGHDPANSSDLRMAKGDLVATGLAGATSTQSGAHSGADAVWRATLTNAPVAICGNDEGTLLQRNHVGTFRVKCRVHSSGTGDYRVRVTWRTGADTPYKSNAWAAPIDGGWAEVDLGLVDIPQVPSGQLQTWHFKIEAESDTPGDEMAVDHVFLIPAEQYGIGRGVTISSSSGAALAYDGFAQAAGALTGETLPLGGTWTAVAAGASTAEDGDADDFQNTGSAVTRNPAADSSVTNGRYVFASTITTAAAIDVSADVRLAKPTTAEVRGGVLARVVDTDNWVMAVIRLFSIAALGGGRISIFKRVAGTVTTLGDMYYSTLWSNPTGTYTVRLTIDTSGNWVVYVDPSTAPSSEAKLSGQDTTHLQTGQTLDDGRIGIYDASTMASAGTRTYDNFLAATPVTGSTFPAIYSGQSAEFRHDSAERENAAGTGWGDIPAYRGARFVLPPAGSTDRTSLVVAKARRDDVNDYRDAIEVDGGALDSTTLSVRYTPRYLVIPRS